MKKLITILATTTLILSCKKNTNKEITYSLNNIDDVQFTWRSESNSNVFNKKKLSVEPNTLIMYYFSSNNQNTYKMEVNFFIDGVPHKDNPFIQDFSVYGGGQVYID